MGDLGSGATGNPRSGLADRELADRVLGGWLGRIAGNMLGKPVERGEVWTRERIDGYLRRAGALPLTDYLPEPADETDALALRPEWRQCVRGRIHGSCRDDDVDYAVLGLHLLETHGFGFSTEQVGELWLLRLPEDRCLPAGSACGVTAARNAGPRAGPAGSFRSAGAAPPVPAHR
ncbi:ADP-ribosylglycohydrolase family protein [Streptomyces sp. NPDC005921]